jgi:2-polyprenyl-3-methyl-5-hydroxy-6-metoxy-1,4-benzoquinol methylase
LKLKRWPIHYLYSDLTNTAFPDESFDAVTCLSVIEHGVDVKAYFKEASRILKPGGLLITSADYWKEGVDASELTAHGTLAKVFAASEIMELLSLAHASRLELTAPLDFECQEKCVTWERLGLQFTFIIFTHRKT